MVPHLQGFAHVQTNPTFPDDMEKTVDNARRIISHVNAIDPRADAKRICIKVPSTWEGLQACRILEAEGIATLATTLFTMPQAVLAGEVNCTYIAPYVYDLRVQVDESYKDINPLFQLPASAQGYYKTHNYRTKVLPASLTTPGDAMRLAGVDHMTVAPKILRELNEMKFNADETAATKSMFDEPPQTQWDTVHFGKDEDLFRKLHEKEHQDGRLQAHSLEEATIAVYWRAKGSNLIERPSGRIKDRDVIPQRKTDGSLNGFPSKINYAAGLQCSLMAVKSPPWGLRWRSSTLFICSTVGIGLFTDLFLYGIVVPILPFMLTDRVHLPHDQIQRHVSGLLAAYAGASVFFSPVAGIIADRYSKSRQLPFLLGLIALLLATIMLGVGKSIPVLAVARVLQGISAAVVWTIGLALVLDTVGPDRLGVIIGSIFGFISVGELAAPVLGGVLYSKAGYGGVFGLGGAILAIDFIMRILLIEKKEAKKYMPDEDRQRDGNADEEQTNGTENDEEPGEEDPLLKKEDPDRFKVPEGQPRAVRSFPLLYCLKDPRLLVALLLALNQATLLATFDATVPTIAQDYYGFSSLEAGVLFIALVLPYLIGGPVAGWIVDKRGPKPAAVIGFGYLVPVLILLRLTTPGGKHQIMIYCVLLALNGIGLAVIGSPSVVEASYVVQQYDKANPGFFGANGPYAQLYGLNSMVFSAGLTLGPIISGALKDSIGYGNMNLAVSIIDLVYESYCMVEALNGLTGSGPVLGDCDTLWFLHQKSRLQEFRSSKWFIYIVIDLAVFTDAYLYGLVIPVLPFALTKYIHIPPADVQKWIGVFVGAYGGGLLISSPIAGYLADNCKSRRPIYMLGLIALASATFILAIGRSVTVLIIARLVQGASSGVVHCVGTAILADAVGQNGIGPAMGWVTFMIALGMVTGPVAGGAIYHSYGYNAVFFSAFIVIALDFVFRILMLDPKQEVALLNEDIPHHPIANGSAIQQVYGTFHDAEPPQDFRRASDSSPGEESSEASHCSSYTSDTSHESEEVNSPSSSEITSHGFQQFDPLLELHANKTTSTFRLPVFFELLTMPRILTALLGAFMESFVLTEIETILPLYIKNLFNYNSKEVGLVCVFLLLPSISSPILGAMTDRFGVKIIVSLGYTFLCPFWILLRLINTDGVASLVGLCVLLFCIGLAVDMVLTPVFIETKEAVDERMEQEPGVFGEKGVYAQAYAQMNMAYAAGSLLGPVLGSALVEEIGWENVTLLTGIACALCVAPSLYALGGRKRKKGKGKGVAGFDGNA
ncbi:uncharacterized protein KY384_008160 [Bacidia gigantensis]|uniref:uncharacterized protein n=1 Tax=Bacidia gigantensis TaxID=2732470 RepID=UPI001D04D719|nr:uncharacterized protein KY384_008160 [Bacidia gigantensis]KAG8526731.1 hypothetical protein KY384_008160 [Bacidia gigantensis]